jgi:hypothetical protein
VSRDNQPQLRIVSQAQYGFFNRRLKYMSERNLDTDPETGIARQTMMRALQSVRYSDLPPKAGRRAAWGWKPQAQAQAQAPLPRIETIKIGSRVACYLVRKPKPVFFIANAEVWDEIHAAMPEVRRSWCLTLKEARSFLEIEGTKVKSLQQAAELWASDCPDEPTLPQPQPKDEKPWVDDENPWAVYGDSDDDGDVADE